MWPESLFFVLKNRHVKHSFDVVHWKTNDLFHQVHDGDFQIRPNEPKLIIGVHFWKKKRTKTKEKSSFSTMGEAVDYVIITQLLSCKICMVLQDSCKTGMGLQEASKKTMFCKKLAR